jgi:hypothetical protein
MICNVTASNSVWYCVRIGGTLVCIEIYIFTRKPGNPITGCRGVVNKMRITIQSMRFS